MWATGEATLCHPTHSAVNLTNPFLPFSLCSPVTADTSLSAHVYAENVALGTILGVPRKRPAGSELTSVGDRRKHASLPFG